MLQVGAAGSVFFVTHLLCWLSKTQSVCLAQQSMIAETTPEHSDVHWSTAAAGATTGAATRATAVSPPQTLMDLWYSPRHLQPVQSASDSQGVPMLQVGAAGSVFFVTHLLCWLSKTQSVCLAQQSIIAETTPEHSDVHWST